MSYQSVFFTKIDYSENIINREKNKPLGSLELPYLLITGTDNPDPLVNFLEEKKLNFNHLKFSNHHRFSVSEIKNIESKRSKKLILTTEKDFARLENYFNSDILFYLPIKMSFFDRTETQRFRSLVQKN